MSERETNSAEPGRGPLFRDMDQREQIYAPEQAANAGMPDHEIDTGGTAASGTAVTGDQDVDDTPVAVPLGTGGSAAAAPASDAFDPGMDREERDMRHGDTDVVGRDARDERGV